MEATNPEYASIYEKADKYLPFIKEIYEGKSQNNQEANLLSGLIELLKQLPEDFHLFCDPRIGQISIFSLTLLSFPDEAARKWLFNTYNPILSKCEKCILAFTRGTCNMLQHFATQRDLPHDRVYKFNDLVTEWRASTCTPILRNISISEDRKSIHITPTVRCAMFEGLCNPHMIRNNPDFKQIFAVIFKYLYDTKYELLDVRSPESIQTFLAGTIYCWYSGTREQESWAKEFLKKLHRENTIITKKSLTPDLLEEMFYYILHLEDPSNWTTENISKFWMKFVPIFALLDTDVFKEYLIVPKDINSLTATYKFPIESIFMLWYKHFSINIANKPLDFLLRAVCILLDKMNSEFWKIIHPYTFHNIIELIFGNNLFVTRLTIVQNIRIPDDDIETYFSNKGSMTDLLSWNLPFYHSLSESTRIQMVKKVSVAFLRIVATYHDLNSTAKLFLMSSSTALLNDILSIKDEERSKLYVQDDFQTILFTKSDSRSLLNNPLIQDIAIKSATNAAQTYPGIGTAVYSVAQSVMAVLSKCIDLDVLLLCQRTYRLYSGKSISELPLPLTLLENLNSKVKLDSFQDGPLLAKYLLISMRNINGLLVVPGQSTIIQKHNGTVKQFLDLSTNLISKFTDVLPNKLSEILADKNASQGFWSCIFSSDANLYQVTTNILYDTFDVEGRLEGIQALLNTSLSYQLRSINTVLRQLIKCEFYEPCPRAIRVLMDILSAFSDPVGGIISNYSSLRDENTDNEIVTFWQLSWSFLDTIYKCTLQWASKYDYSELENFTKDTLELSRSFVNSFREFSDIISSSGVDLFDSVLKAFKNMLYWLRLSDDELLESCVRLIISATDLAFERKMKFGDEIVTSLTQYAVKAKRHSNKLTASQTSEILTKAKLFNSRLVTSIVDSVEESRKGKEALRHPTVRLPSLDESRADFLQRKATSSSILGRPKSTQPKITNFGVFKSGADMTLQTKKAPKPLSKMELARKQLMSNRIVHPPSTSVFHTKPKTKTKGGDSSDSDSDAEGDLETARELFASTRAKSHTIETVDINGKNIKRNTKAEIARMEEENMRRRLNVDLNPLYETMLKWNYTRKNEYPNDETSQYTDIKDKFTSASEYRKIVKPLLLLECWQGLCAARDRIDNIPFSVICGNRRVVSDFYDIFTSMSKSFVESSKISESDLIAMAYFPNLHPGEKPSNDDFRKAENTCLAKIRSINYAKNNTVEITLRIHRNQPFSKFLTLRSEIHAIKVMQMTTVEREYQTIEALEYYDLVDQILAAKPSPPAHVSPNEVENVKRCYKLNTSQAQAIVNTVLNEGFSLIQGPPGTGKTKTILGIVGYILSLRNALPSNVITVPTGQANNTMDQLLKKQKVLICAPSNAAVDEICIRLKDGVYDKNGNLIKPRVVRVGRSDVVNVAIKELTLEELVERRVSAKNQEYLQNPELDQKFHATVLERRELMFKLNSENGKPESKLSSEDMRKLQTQIRELSKTLNILGKEKDELREQRSLNSRKRDIDRRNAQAQVLSESDIICSTLSGSAHDVLATLGIKFDTVIIDEACQCTELSSIIPLRYGGKRCIMVGDPNQLPPTVLSGAASNFKYNQSLFVRMEKNTTPYLLNVQYRMHPDISRFPSLEFYNGRLLDGPDMAMINKRPWHTCPPLQPYKFFDISTGQQEQNKKTMSYVNTEEINVAVELINFLFTKFENDVDFTGKIGVISPYKEQMQRMRRQFTSYFGSFINKYIDFNTIDGFQGQEKEIIIISCVRADDTKSSVGFLKDFRRMNVAFTRAKTSLWILGHRNSLYQNKLWRNLIEDAESRHSIQKAYAGFLSDKQPKERINTVVGTNDDSYNPLDIADRAGRKRPAISESLSMQPQQKKPKDIPIKEIELAEGEEKRLKREEKQRKKEKKEKRDKKENKEKKEKKKERKDKKEKKDNNEKGFEKENKNGSSSGTKRKSSFFGPTKSPSPSTAPNNNIYINDEKIKKQRKSSSLKDNRHLKFVDDIIAIPESVWDKIPPSNSNPRPLKSAMKGKDLKRTDNKEDSNTKNKKPSGSLNNNISKSNTRETDTLNKEAKVSNVSASHANDLIVEKHASGSPPDDDYDPTASLGTKNEKEDTVVPPVTANLKTETNSNDKLSRSVLGKQNEISTSTSASTEQSNVNGSSRLEPRAIDKIQTLPSNPPRISYTNHEEPQSMSASFKDRITPISRYGTSSKESRFESTPSPGSTLPYKSREYSNNFAQHNGQPSGFHGYYNNNNINNNNFNNNFGNNPDTRYNNYPNARYEHSQNSETSRHPNANYHNGVNAGFGSNMNTNHDTKSYLGYNSYQNSRYGPSSSEHHQNDPYYPGSTNRYHSPPLSNAETVSEESRTPSNGPSKNSRRTPAPSPFIPKRKRTFK
ncbi:similar to Saccharomyces cerevisiae YLR430W SEN1 Presumed helicase required for RNA polymerase II transcription termination and processing of RNAs [Maudiozyma saulgeensis]|uniref:Similar to Saccharomyces cerevisiae YLR430W SEN1 Presumed helicase required for RNA polymerase II transcription termination and processing of RNAs n=1 Tax=Maudiozyma saulgeensis TaxID=1789683 RepID=A0A1X7R8M2_9SACH|nr:similar to Saccharomyces cerevisiae YLR430W SEN1 Presumed helicase required for RNA polymerase II transcription termination and processing of RNAs [Kazachstania saulgeensis]